MCVFFFFFFKFISLSTVANLRSFDGVGDGDNTESGLERERVSTLLPLSRFLFFLGVMEVELLK